MRFVRQTWDIIVDAAMGWLDDEALTRGAAIAFYTIFALAPFVILVTAVAGLAIGRQAAQDALMDEVGHLIGREAVTTLQSLAASADDARSGVAASIFGISTILVGATTVFAELHTSLNRIWKAEPPDSSTITWLVMVRLKGLALIGAIGFLLIVSLVVSAILAAFSRWFSGILPDLFVLIWITNLISSLTVFTVLFALVYRALPDTRIPWMDLWLGAAITAVLFTIGKSLIGLYLGTTGITSAYGAAGSFVLILLWVYYSATIFLFGAEITRSYSEHVGSRAGSSRRDGAERQDIGAAHAPGDNRRNSPSE
jgi:membrane protein